MTTTAIKPDAATNGVESTTTVSPAPKTARVRVMHDLAALFPEVSGIENSAARHMPGFREAGPGVPARIPGFLQESSFLEEFTYFVNSSAEFMLVLTGPTGCGKTERVLDFYSRLNIPVLHKAATSDMKPWDFIGSRELIGGDTKYVPGPLYKAMKYGYPFLLDEAFRLSPKITSKLHTVRDRGELLIDETGETLKAARGFKFIMTANQTGYGDTTGFYPGDNEQDLAFLNGMSSIECTYPAPDVETAIVQAALEKAHPAFSSEPALAHFAPKMVAVANKVRSLFVGNEDGADTENRVEIAISTRTLIKWAAAFVAFRGSQNPVHPLHRALDYVALRKACLATRLTVDGIVLAELGIERRDTH